jgi:hypothetical protein
MGQRRQVRTPATRQPHLRKRMRKARQAAIKAGKRRRA